MGLASRRGITRSEQFGLDKGVYYQVRERFGLSAQMAVRAIAKRVDAYALDKRMFRKDGAFPYVERILSWDLGSETVWLWRVARRRRMLTPQVSETDILARGGRPLASTRATPSQLARLRGAYWRSWGRQRRKSRAVQRD